MPTTSEAWSTVMRSIGALAAERAWRTADSSPTIMRCTSCCCFKKARAPGTVTARPESPPMASTANVIMLFSGLCCEAEEGRCRTPLWVCSASQSVSDDLFAIRGTGSSEKGGMCGRGFGLKGCVPHSNAFYEDTLKRGKISFCRCSKDFAFAVSGEGGLLRRGLIFCLRRQGGCVRRCRVRPKGS